MQESFIRRQHRLRGGLKEAGRVAVLGFIALVVVIGVQYLTRGTAVNHVRGVGSDGSPVSPHEPEFPSTVVMLTGAILLEGNHVEIALNGDGTYPRLWEDLRSAKRSITLQLYYGQDGEMARTLREILLERAAAGVRIFLLYDAFGARIPDEHRSTLEKAGVVVVPFRPITLRSLYLSQNRSHVRGIVIDGRVGWTGGFGIDDKWLGDGQTNGSWRETNVRVEGPAVRQLQAAFAAAWAEATGVLFSGRVTGELQGASGVTAGLLYATPTMGSTSAERFLAMSIAAARKSLFITNAYFIPDDNLIALLLNAASRGVDVRILTAGPRTDVDVVRQAGRSRYEELMAAGIRIYEWQPSTLHAKTFVIDERWSTIGSINLDNRSLVLNDEATLMILDQAVGQQMEAIFFNDLHHAEEIKLEEFRRRGWRSRMVEKMARQVAPVL